MAPIRTPEGFVRVEKVAGIAAKLLDAADLTEGADRKADVRTVTGAYHVSEAVYETFKSTFGEDPAAEAGAAEAQHQADAEAAAAAAAEAERAEAERVAGEEAAAKAAAEQVAAEQPDESWTHEQLNEYAGKLTPPLELTGSTPAKAEKVKLIAEHVEQNKA